MIPLPLLNETNCVATRKDILAKIVLLFLLFVVFNIPSFPINLGDENAAPHDFAVPRRNERFQKAEVHLVAKPSPRSWRFQDGLPPAVMRLQRDADARLHSQANH